jgi:hypothetical protein
LPASLRHVLEFLCQQTFVSHAGQSKEWWSDLRIKLELGVTGSKAAIDRLAREMLANGWIELARRYGRVRRYRLTDAGRSCAAVLQPLFKSPAAQSRIRPAPRAAGQLGWGVCSSAAYKA